MRDGESEPSSQRGQRERQHEAVVKTIGEEEEEPGGHQQIEIPLSGEHMKPRLKVSEFHGPNEATEVKDVIENQTGRRSFPRRPSGCAGEAVPKTDSEHCGEDGQHEDVTQLLRPCADGPAEAGDERQNTSVEENIQLKKNGKRLSTREACQECVLFRRYNAGLLPSLQSC